MLLFYSKQNHVLVNMYLLTALSVITESLKKRAYKERVPQIYYKNFSNDSLVSNSHNITQTYNTKINKYLELSVAMRNLW
jgi:hypothetical protein